MPIKVATVKTWNYKFGKRLLDLVSAISGLIFLSPLIAFLAALVRFKLGSPIFFRQTRPGLHGKPFTIIKFRTLTDKRDVDGVLLPDSERQTWFGGILRKTSMDEFPEFINVLKGEMSIVGPRPLLMQYLDRYTPEQMRRHEVRPGITGWAQVNGRTLISWERKLRLDVWYVDHLSLWLDLKIMWMTIGKVICRDGISPTTGPEFSGNRQEK